VDATTGSGRSSQRPSPAAAHLRRALRRWGCVEDHVMSIPRLSSNHNDAPAPFPFPRDHLRDSPSGKGDLGDRVLGEFEAMSRRIGDLARELNCLGYFEEDDRPRAA
jgi:hypothetical protein